MGNVVVDGVADSGAQADGGAPDARDASARLLVVLVRLLRMVRRHAPQTIGHSAVSALAVVHEYGPLRVGDLAAREGVTAPSITRVLGHLESAGYVTRDPDPEDGRASLIRTTAEGARCARGSWESQGRGLAERLERLPAHEVEVLLAALPVLEALATDAR